MTRALAARLNRLEGVSRERRTFVIWGDDDQVPEGAKETDLILRVSWLPEGIEAQLVEND
jgi:hypothetical protein